MPVVSSASLVAGALSARAVAAVAGSGGAAIVALYLLRLRRRRVPVAFSALWPGGDGDGRAARRAQSLRHGLSLVLALVTFAALLLGAANPSRAPVDGGGRTIVVLIDRSASMSATDEPGTRLAAAKAEAGALIAGLSAFDRALVASFAADAERETGFDSDQAHLTEAIGRIRASDEAGDLPRALAFASAALRGRPRPTVVLVSDGGFADDQLGSAPEGVDIRFLPVGRRANNIGIVSFGARRELGDPASVEMSLRVASFRREGATVPIELWTDGRLVARRTVSLSPGQTAPVMLREVIARGAVVEARLVAEDDLASDNRAIATIPALPQRRVLRVGGADLFLDGALLSLGRNVTVERLSAKDADRAVAAAARYDLVILDGVTPSIPPQTGRFLIFDPAGEGSPFAARGTVPDPVLDPASVRRDHPLMRGLDLSDVNIAEARRLVPATGDLTLAGSFAVPLMIARERLGLRLAALAFDPRRSDLPMRPAFPLLVANALEWASGASPADEAPPSASASGRDARESDTAPVRNLRLGGRALAPPDPPARRRRRDAATSSLVLAALLLLAESVTYHRRWTT
jgi:VWA domain-containing protein